MRRRAVLLLVILLLPALARADDSAERLMQTMEGFRERLPPPKDLGEQNGFGITDAKGRSFLYSHLQGIGQRLGVRTKSDCMVMLTYLNDADLPIRVIAAEAIENSMHCYPDGMSADDMTKVGSGGHQKMVLRFVEAIGRQATTSPVSSAPAAEADRAATKPLFPEIPPTADADPNVRHEVLIQVPTKLDLKRTGESLSISVAADGRESTKMAVGSKMTTGVCGKLFIYPAGEARPAAAWSESLSGGTDFNMGTDILHAEQGGVPTRGKRYLVELELSVFETDVPAQHMWTPESGGKYRVLLRRTLKQTVEGE